MKGMIFAAGLGTRLAPLTDTCPKSLIEVGGRPMLERVIRHLIRAGVSDIVVNVHHHAEMVKEYIASHDFGVPIHISDESDRLLDTGGGVVKAAPLLENADDIILYNADIFTDVVLSEMVEYHRRNRNNATLLTSTTRNSSRRLLFDPLSGLLKGWRNMHTGEIRSPFSRDVTNNCLPEAFGGIHIINRLTLERLKEWGTDDKFSITPFYTDICDRLCISSFHPSADYTWIDIGRPETLAQARAIASDK